MQLADSQERHAQLGDRVIEAERRPNEAREQQRSLEPGAGGAVLAAQPAGGAAELARTIDTAASKRATLQDERQRALRTSWRACPTPPPRAGCSRRWN